MSRILFGLLLLLAALIQATILPRINPFPVGPDFVLVFLFTWSASRSARESLFWVFFAGVALDVLALDAFGTNALALVFVVAAAGLARQRVAHANLLVTMLLVAAATLVHALVLSGLRGDWPTGWHVPIQALVHASLMPALYVFLRVLGR